ncbi:MAG: transglutaminase-like cysteine peptidase [Alphaproteobacteria bacterium]|nr:transglutaminase-like cysteine peptidase [Alphaproteobacteria bacterium]
MALFFPHRSLGRLALIAVFAWAIIGSAQAQNVPPRLFGSIEFIGGSLAALPQWVRVLDRIKGESAIYEACHRDINDCPFPAMAAWRAQIRGLEGLPRRRQMAELNRFLNRWTYRPDQENFDVEDYWATPMEFLDRSGDCEDYAIIKYVSLKALGFPVEKLRIVVVRDVLRDIAHAVLAVYIDNDILIMDSLFAGVLSHKFVTFYKPQYSVNEKTRWAHIMPMISRPSGNLGVSR